MNNTILHKRIVIITLILLALFFCINLTGLNESKKENQPVQTTFKKTEVVSIIPEEKTNTSLFPILSDYIEIIDGCGPYHNISPCVNMRSGPGIQYPIINRLRTGMVFKVSSTTTDNDHSWYKIINDKSIRYPKRVNNDWYVAADPVSISFFKNIGEEILKNKSATTTKKIIINLSKEMLYAYDNEELFMQNPISTGLELTPTPVGKFKVFKKTPSRYMQGPIPEVSDQYYDLPGVPWNLYFTTGGAVIHGAYWHDHFGEPWSHGCVNLPPDKAKKLYFWADIGTPVIVEN